MKANMGTVILALVLVFMFFSPTQAQYFKFSNELYQNNDEVRDAVEGVLKFFNSFVGGGLFHTAKLHSVGGIDVGLRGVVANVPDDLELLPVFIDESRIGLAFLHGSIGLPGRFELMGRFFYFPLGADADLTLEPPRARDSRGGVTLIGGGVKYGLVQAPGLPKITLLGAFHALGVPDEFDFGTVNTLSFKAIASHSLAIVTVYAAGGFDFTRLSLDDDLPDFPDLAGESFDGSNGHFTLGVTANVFPFVHVNGSYSFSEFNSFDLGLGISFR